ncbi:MAG TPA: TonB-dependent receptor [Rhizomicrobium sp.]|nr:TonB-dependent receptor [Rhizomicrobium sp.]
MKLNYLKSALVGSTAVIAFAMPAMADQFNIPSGDLATALDAYSAQTGIELLYAAGAVKGRHTRGAKGDLSADAALTHILAGTGYMMRRTASGAIGVIHDVPEASEPAHTRVAEASSVKAAAAGIESVVVTSSKIKGDIQTVPIAITALSQEQLTSRQIAGGPDLVKEVPNLTFSKTNFSGYNLEIRGIGTQAISVTTDPAVAVAFNDIPFIRNHFFEQEFYDLSQAEVLRGPQGTLYGRNATAGVVNLVSAKPTDQFEAMLSADIGNYHNRRFEGMINVPIVDDRLGLRIAGEWTKRDGYSFNQITNRPIDGRDLWSGRVTLAFKPTDDLQTTLVWEHFQEDDDRLRSGKQLCETAPIPDKVDGQSTLDKGSSFAPGDYLSQGCLPSSLYSKEAFQVPNGFSLPYYSGFVSDDPFVRANFDPYSGTTQSTNLRDIQSSIPSIYKAKNDVVEFNADYKILPALTFTSQTGYNQDFLWSTEDYNRFETARGIFIDWEGVKRGISSPDPNAGKNGIPDDAGVFCDPQLGCQDRLVVQDLNSERAWQLSQEFRLASQFSGPLNFSAGANFLHYETEENYYVFINTVTQWVANNTAADYGIFYTPGVTDESACLPGYRYPNDNVGYSVINGCNFIDPNPISSLNGQGHNYFLSKNPYLLNSYALFGEAYYDIASDLKLTTGLRWTDDQKRFNEIPSELLIMYYGYPSAGIVDQQWKKFTGRGVLSWTPKLAFTDQTLVYASAARGYKAGGANPPGAIFPTVTFAGNTTTINPVHPLTFRPEYIDAYELGTKNSLLDGSLTFNAGVFYYNYKNYQISRIVDRTAINDNFNAHVMGAELESTWEPLPGLSFNLAAGFEDAKLAKGTKSVDLIDRTAGNSDWMVVKPFVSNASNCILPTYVVAALLQSDSGDIPYACGNAYNLGLDPLTRLPYTQNPTMVAAPDGPVPADLNGYKGFNPATAPNNGQGFDKNLSNNVMPNAPPVTLSMGAQYAFPVSTDWAATLRSDFYFQADSWARVFNDNPYDRLHGYTTLNLALILNSANGWQVMGYVKNVFNTTAITGDFLNSDDTGLTTNVFLTDPRLFGIRVTKNLDLGEWASADSGGSSDSGKHPTVWVEFGGDFDRLRTPQDSLSPLFGDAFTIPAQKHALDVQKPPSFAFDEEAKISFEPEDSSWVFSGAIRFGRTGANRHCHQQTKNPDVHYAFHTKYIGKYLHGSLYPSRHVKMADGQSRFSENHAIVDFSVGKEVGFGSMGMDASSVISGGVRSVQFGSSSHVTLRGEPDVHYPSGPLTSFDEWAHFKYERPPLTIHDYSASLDASRSFHGIGPSAAWDASLPVSGSTADGELDFDWGLNAALLFGRQKASGHHQTQTNTYKLVNWENNFNGGHGYDRVGYFQPQAPYAVHSTGANFNRERSVVVPNLGAFAGLSMKYTNAKLSLGYRADFFFGAMDGGIDTRKTETQGFHGPFASVSVGIGD